MITGKGHGSTPPCSSTSDGAGASSRAESFWTRFAGGRGGGREGERKGELTAGATALLRARARGPFRTAAGAAGASFLFAPRFHTKGQLSSRKHLHHHIR